MSDQHSVCKVIVLFSAHLVSTFVTSHLESSIVPCNPSFLYLYLWHSSFSIFDFRFAPKFSTLTHHFIRFRCQCLSMFIMIIPLVPCSFYPESAFVPFYFLDLLLDWEIFITIRNLFCVVSSCTRVREPRIRRPVTDLKVWRKEIDLSLESAWDYECLTAY